MAKYRIGITERGDAGLDLSWASKLDTVDGAIVITKFLSPACYDALLANKEKLILHATLTGYGHSVLEPAVPPPYEELDALMTLVNAGFPKEKVVIRVDPIIPTEKGLRTADGVIWECMRKGFSRYRVSLIDMYQHARDRFAAKGLPCPYGPSGFAPNQEQLAAANKLLWGAKVYWTAEFGCPLEDLRIESCAEPGLTEAISCGCISPYDLSLLGLEDKDAAATGPQRKNCLCYPGKTELLSNRKQCGHGCVDCYWH